MCLPGAWIRGLVGVFWGSGTRQVPSGLGGWECRVPVLTEPEGTFIVNPVSQLSRRFRVAFDDHRTVPNAGLVIPMRLADKVGVPQGVNNRVGGSGRKNVPNSGDKALNLVAMLISGGEFISDVEVLRAGSTMHRLGYRRFSSSRLGEWLRSLTARDIEGLADALGEATATAWSQQLGADLLPVSESEPLIIDIDATFTETYGTRKDGTEARNYLNRRGYHPLLAVAASSGEVICARLRAGNTAPAYGASDFAAEAINRMRRLAGDSTDLLLRADSGFYLKALFDHCVASNVRFSVTVRQFAAIRELITSIEDSQWRTVSATATEHIDIADVPYTIKGAAGTNPIECRLIVRRHTTITDATDPQLRLFELTDYHALVTDQNGDPETLWRRHKQRATIETTIRDLKYGLALNHFPSGSFTANAAWLQLNALAHNLCRWTNQLLTTQPLTTKTLRYRYLNIPGRITTGSRTTTLHLPNQWPRQHHITQALTTINHPNAA